MLARMEMDYKMGKLENARLAFIIGLDSFQTTSPPGDHC